MGSAQDRVLRNFLVKESEKEVIKTHLLALLVTNSVPFGEDTNAGREWETKIRKLFTTYNGLEYGIEIPENTEKELEVIKFYNGVIKNLKPVLNKSKDGRFVVSGLDSLRE